MGGLNYVVRSDVFLMLIPFAAGVIPLFLLRWRLNLLSLEDDEARALGVNTGAMRIVFILCATLISSSSVAVGGMIVQSAVNPMGVAFIAGYTATNKLYGLLEIAAVNYGYALMTYAGQNYGAKRHDRIRAGVRAGVFAGVLTALGIAGLMLLFGRSLLSLFVDPAANGYRSVGFSVRLVRPVE